MSTFGRGCRMLHMAEKQPKKTGTPPYALALIMCDQIYKDMATGKKSLLGMYSAITAASFPAVHPTAAIFIALTDGRGEEPIKIRLMDVNEEREPVFEIKAVVNFANPLAVIELSLQTPAFEFPAPGEYRLQLFGGVDDDPLMERRIMLLLTRNES